MRPDRTPAPDRTGPARPRSSDGARLHPFSLVGAGVVLAVALWTFSDYSAVVDTRVVALELAAAAVSTGALLCARSPSARRGLGLITAFTALTALGDVYWLASTRDPGLSYAVGEVEPGVTVTVVVVRYLALAGLLAHVLPRHRADVGTAARRWWSLPGPGWWDGRTAVAHVQATTTTAALVLLCTPVGDLIARGSSPSLFCVFDVVVTALAGAAVVTALSASPRPGRGELRLLLVTAAGVTGIAVGDSVTVLSQLQGGELGGALGLGLAVAAGTVLIVTHLNAPPARTDAPSALPPVTAGVRPDLAAAVSVLVQHVLPLLIAVVATAQLVAASDSGAVDTVGAATVGTAAAAVLASSLQVGVRARRAHRDEHDAAAAERDDLTGAYSRRGFTSLVHRTVAEGSGNGRGWSLALLDLDGFKAVNDTFGHDVGDQVLTAAARRAADVLQGRGALARFGGDEFVALLATGPAEAEATGALVQRLQEAISTPVLLGDGSSLRVGVSIGVADIVGDGRPDDVATTLKLADQRMYELKHRGRQALDPA